MGFASVVGYQQQEQQFSSSSNSLACPAYVGQQNSLAGEYHSKDFDWHDHAQRTANLVEKQWAAAPAAQPDSSNEWEVFYRAHPSARFYKERRYLLLEFPCLAPPAQLQHIVEVGAGCGSSILPVMRAQPQAQVTVCDVSATCLEQLQGAMQLLGLEPQRCRSFVADGTDPGLAQQLAGCCADVALIMFTLSAVEPAGMLAMLRNAAASLRPGGLLCVRDHALYDMVQLRIPPEQCIGRHIYRRGDGTLAYFYTTQELAGLAAAAGLVVVECEYVCVFNRNRKTGLELRRTFVHGVFRRPQLLW
ncbi:S-adenosyl-L-methionine-dependent methyltransferase [Scenedesmus sp. NREL 46B-D3]|nr:S-adenosyl-L-methionine-dependent methyltransferase [Scenedesmus sp. NREL 46B-D3]